MTKNLKKITKVVNLYKESYDVYIGRAGKGRCGYFGNPFIVESEKDRENCLDNFAVYFYERLNDDPKFKKNVEQLRGKILGCFCKPKSCHGDIIADWLNAEIG